MPPRRSKTPEIFQSRPPRVFVNWTMNSSRKTKVEGLPALEIEESLTPEYVPPTTPFRELTREERDNFIHDLIAFDPTSMWSDITDEGRKPIYSVTQNIGEWLYRILEKEGGHNNEIEREVDIGLHALETLFESHIDKSFDRLVAWALRNPFDIPKDLQVVLPWHKGFDFYRGEHVANMEGGENAILEKLEKMRSQVEQARYVDQELTRAEALLDRRLEIARQRKAEVGFVAEKLAASGLSPLPPKAQSIATSLQTLHSTITPLEIPIPQIPQPPNNTKAWEMGRQAYLNWAVGKLVDEHTGNVSAGGGVDERMEAVEKELESVGGKESVEAALRGGGGVS